jgi:tRNA (mo5U34)-methyltransferase
MIQRAAYTELLDGSACAFPEAWRALLPGQLAAAFSTDRHGRWPEWQSILESLPRIAADRCDMTNDVVAFESTGEIGPDDRRAVEHWLRALHPWRKGPFRIHGVTIDAEWRSNLKWRRLEPCITPLAGRTVLDIGCGNGYYAWRMCGQGARLVVGVDPTIGHVVQFLAVRHFAGSYPVYVLPLGIEDIPAGLAFFDTVFSMGVLYHRRSPIDHLFELKACLRPGGELVLETLIVDGDDGRALLPADRYAQMRNVWFLPSLATLESWLKRCGFREIRTGDVTPTTVAEQRSTSWMQFQSLADFLDPTDPGLTVEGLPAPRRAIVIAEAP